MDLYLTLKIKVSSCFLFNFLIYLFIYLYILFFFLLNLGVDPETVVVPLANHLRPMLINAWNERKKASLTDNAQKIKRVLDNLQKKLDEVTYI